MCWARGTRQTWPSEFLPGWEGTRVTIGGEVVEHLLPFALSGSQLRAPEQAAQPSPYSTKHLVLPPQPILPS
eukprot:scaffold3332_cov130-Isochrysis_galbana.AAC.1